jgi:hypothetical protein
MNYHELENELLKATGNALILGSGGSGKSHTIKNLLEARKDIIAVSPTGIAAIQIHGYTIHYHFGIKPNTYVYNRRIMNNIPQNLYFNILSANILLIDEISMVSCYLLDIVDQELRDIKKNNLPFGGLRLLFFGDMYQLPPVVKDSDIPFLVENKLYFQYNEVYGFYNARVMTRNNYFHTTFKKYMLMRDYRHKDFPIFKQVLDNVRVDKMTNADMNLINSRVSPMFYDEKYQYLTTNHKEADELNDIFITEYLNGTLYTVEREVSILNETFYEIIIENPYESNLLEDCNLYYDLTLKKGMKVIFTKNDRMANGFRWANGTIGRVIDIVNDGMNVIAVQVSINGKLFWVEKDSMTVRTYIGKKFQKVARVSQFPFKPAYAVTIDKSQGMTLDKVFIRMSNNMRENLMYVGLSRVRSLEDLYVDRAIQWSDVTLNRDVKMFMASIASEIIEVYDDEAVTVKNIETAVRTPEA